MTERRSRAGDLTRRRFLQGAAVAGSAAFLAACAPSRASTVPPTVRSASASAGTDSPPPSPSAGDVTSDALPTGPLRFANREAYIDIAQDGTSPMLVEFEAAHGIAVQYANAAIADDASFIASIRAALEAGAPTGWDLIVVSDWMAARLASSAFPDDVFAYPDEGWLLTSHSLVIPKGAEHKHATQLMIDWVYDVDRAARLATWTYYISPVKGVAEAITALDTRAASNPLLFPSAEALGRQHAPPTFSESEERGLRATWEELTG